MDHEVHRASRGRSTDTSSDPEMVEGRGIGRRPVVGDKGGNAAGSSSFAAARQRVPALCLRFMGRVLAQESCERRRDRRPLRRRSCVGFQCRTDAERFLQEFRGRLVEFGRFAARNRKQRGEGKPETFTFLGFTHFCGQRKTNGAFTVWRITAKKRMVAKLKAIKTELQRRKHHRTTEVGAWLRMVGLGYYRYHAVPGNSTQLRIFSRRVCWLWRSVLVRRSQRAQVRWDRLYPLLNRWIPRPRILHPYPSARFAATHPW